MTPYDVYSIKIHVRTMTLADISHKQKEKISIIQLFKNLYMLFK